MFFCFSKGRSELYCNMYFFFELLFTHSQLTWSDFYFSSQTIYSSQMHWIEIFTRRGRQFENKIITTKGEVYGKLRAFFCLSCGRSDLEYQVRHSVRRIKLDRALYWSAREKLLYQRKGARKRGINRIKKGHETVSLIAVFVLVCFALEVYNFFWENLDTNKKTSLTHSRGL